MADIKTPEERSRNMSRIRSSDTHPEVIFRKWLFSEGYRYSLGNRKIVGRPDLWMPKYNVAIFVHGCFWHRHNGCKYSYIPKSNQDYWLSKFKKNVLRDKYVGRELSKKGIRYLIVWECTVKKMEKSIETRNMIIGKIIQFLNSNKINMEL